MPTNARTVSGQLLHIKAKSGRLCVNMCVCPRVCVQGLQGGAGHSCLIFVKLFFSSLIGRRVAVTYHPHKPLPPASCLSSQRRHMAAFQARPPHTPIPGKGLCSPRCGCPTPLRPLMCIWKRRARLVPTGPGEQGRGGGGGESLTATGQDDLVGVV